MYFYNSCSKNKQSGQSHPQPGSMAPGGPSVGVPDPINALQNLTRQGNAPSPMGMAQGPPTSQLGQALVGPPLNQQQMTLGPGNQPNPQAFATMPRMLRHENMMPGNMPTNIQMAQLQKMKQQQNQMQSGGLNEALLMSGQPQQGGPPFMQGGGPPGHPRPDTQATQFMGQSPNPVQHPGHLQTVPSPAQAPPNVTSNQIAMSPASYIASPNSQIIPSPLGSMGPQSTGRTPGPASAPSPNSSLNTPGTVPSPAGRHPHDDQMYLDKVKQLNKYIEPLRRMIARIAQDEDKKKEMNKMKNLLDILSDTSKRVPMEMLLKCEQVLERLDLKIKPSDSSVPLPPGQPKEPGMSHPLLDAITAHIKSPFLNHTLQRTFGPAMAALHGPPIKCPSPPTKRRKQEDEGGADISDILQGEIARLDQRFKVSLDPIQHIGSRTVHLICQLDDKNLPCVPPITITVPENYPQQTPQCDTSSEEYGSDSTPFLQAVQLALSARLMKMPDKFSVTSLLDTWEMSVRQACAPRPAVSSTTK